MPGIKTIIFQPTNNVSTSMQLVYSIVCDFNGIILSNYSNIMEKRLNSVFSTTNFHKVMITEKLQWASFNEIFGEYERHLKTTK